MPRAGKAGRRGGVRHKQRPSIPKRQRTAAFAKMHALAQWIARLQQPDEALRKDG